MPQYKLTSPYWSGTAMHKRGEVIELSEGAAVPPGSVLVEEKEPELDLEPKPETKKK